MITIILVAEACIILLLKNFGMAGSPYVIFLIAAIITGVLAFVLKGKVTCFFGKMCPFKICPLNKLK